MIIIRDSNPFSLVIYLIDLYNENYTLMIFIHTQILYCL